MNDWKDCTQGGEEKRGAQTASDKEAKRREREQRREAAAAEAAEARRKQAELELLLMDESEVRQGKSTGEPTAKLQFFVSDCSIAFLQAPCSLLQGCRRCAQLPECAIRAAGLMASQPSPAIMQAE